MADHALYLEVDEDITSAIDKLRKAPGASVQIVVPKRSGILQSIINLKLLKKAAETAGKELILVTNDKVAGDLAGRIGIPVAASIGGRPVINEPAKPMPKNDFDEIIEADDPMPVGDLMDIDDKPEKAATATNRPAFSRRDIDKPKPAAVAPTAALAAEEVLADASEEALSPPTHHTASGSSKVPSFTKLQRRLGWAGLAIALIVGYIVTMYFLTSANVKLYAIGTKVSVDGSFVADTAAGQSNSTKGILAAQEVTFTKDATTPVTPTGQKDNGTKANGTITVTNSYDSNPQPLQTGTRFIAPDGNVFRTTEDVLVPGAGVAGGQISPGSKTVSVTSDQNGDKYNEASGQKYSIPGLSAGQQAKIYGTGNQMSGGTSKIATVLTQADVDKAQADYLSKDTDAAFKSLSDKFGKAGKPLPDTFSHTVSDIVPNPGVGQEATVATLNFKVTYTTLTVDSNIFNAYIHAQEQGQVGPKNQLYDDGIGSTKLTNSGKDAAGRFMFQFSTLAYSGTKLDTTAIATQLKGQKYGEASALAGGLPGVDHVEINVWPAWSTSLPKRPARIHVTVSVANSKG